MRKSKINEEIEMINTCVETLTKSFPIEKNGSYQYIIYLMLMKSIEKLKKELFELAVSLGGTLSGEHGIVCQKARYLNLALSTETLYIMKKIKKVFDPDNIMNPGKFL